MANVVVDHYRGDINFECTLEELQGMIASGITHYGKDAKVKITVDGSAPDLITSVQITAHLPTKINSQENKNEIALCPEIEGPE